MEVIHGQLIAIDEDIGGYVKYVFKDLDETSYNKYQWCVKPPRWESGLLKLGDVGFVKFVEVVAGKDTWYDKETNDTHFYKQTQVYFIDFIHDKPQTDDIIL